MRSLAIFICLLSFVPRVPAQTVTVVSSYLGGKRPVRGTMTWQLTTTGGTVASTNLNPAAAAGITTVQPLVATVTAGVSSLSDVTDTTAANPANLCYKVTVKLANGLQALGPGHDCVQTAQNNDWCTNGVCNFDKYVPNLAHDSLAVVQSGPVGPKGDTGNSGANGVASLPSLAQLRLSTLPAVANFLDPALLTANNFVDVNTGGLISRVGYMASGKIAANAGGWMISDTEIPAVSVTTTVLPGSSTVNQYDVTTQSGPANGQILDASTGTYLPGNFTGYGSSSFAYFPPGTTQFTTNAPFFCGFNGKSGIAFYDANQTYVSGTAVCTTGGSDLHAQTVTLPSGTCSSTAGCYARWAILYYNDTGNSFIAVAGNALPSTYVAFAASLSPHSNGVAMYDVNGNVLPGLYGRIAAFNSFPIRSDAAWIEIGFASGTNPSVYNGRSVPSAPLPFVGTPVASSAPSLTQLWPAMAGADWWLPLNETSGTTIHDATGNGHNAAISGGGTAAAWAAFGLQLNGQTASVPNAAGRAAFGFCADFPGGGAPGNYGYVYSLAVGAQNGYNLGGTYGPYFAGVSLPHGPLAYFPALGRSNGGPYSIGNDGFSGHHCVSGLQDGTVLVDGREVSSYVYKSASDAVGGGELTNAMTLIGGNGTQTGTPVTLYSAWGGPGTTAVEIARQKSEMARLQVAGVAFGGVATSQASDNVCTVDGTSIDQGFQASNVRPITLVTFAVPCTVYDFSVSGQTPMDMASAFEARAGAVVHPYASRNIAYTGGVTNGVVAYNETPTQALADVLTWNRKAHAAGYKTIATTAVSRCGNNQAGTANADSLLQTYNAALLAVADEFDWLDNPAAWPALGATNACANTVDFADGVHPNTTGQALYVQNEQVAFNGVYRSPVPRSVTASAAQAPPDSVITANCATACTLTLLDANTVSFNRAGRLTVRNLGPAAVTIAAVSGETVNAAATLILGAGNSITIMPYIANPAAGGAQWISTQ